MRYVVDSQFFLIGMDPLGIDGEIFITPEIRNEISKGFPGRKMEYFIESQRIIVCEPDISAVEKIRKTAMVTGDIDRLSRADISLLALAFQISAVLLTDDYSIQNLAKYLEIPYKNISEGGIKDIWRWRFRCTGCGRIFDTYHDECPVCGSPLRQIPRKT